MGFDWNLDGKYDWQDDALFFYLIANEFNSDEFDASSGKGRKSVPSETQTNNSEHDQFTVVIAVFLTILIFIAIFTGYWVFIPILFVCFIITVRFI